MENFDFPFHIHQDIFPDSSGKVKFGAGYQFASTPIGPDQLIFVLSFPGMRFNDADDQKNFVKLLNFYERHRQWKIFVYPHPLRGDVRVRFDTPLSSPKGIPGGNGVVEPFEVRLILQP